MKIKLSVVCCLLSAVFIFQPVKQSFAIQNPFASFNNKFGIHILFPEELSKAAELINSSGGDWGYVIIPIQAGDKDIVKWQQFMDSAKQNHIIPILRLATEGDYFNTKVWRKPKETDIVDFANFLNSLDWPVKNKYIVVFNEVNRGDEWGGSVNSVEYANLLAYAINVFKSKNQDFFMISSGLDNAAPQAPPQFKNEYIYLKEMNDAVPGIFNQIDGLSSHSYPNPAFSAPPSLSGKMGIDSFTYERALIRTMSAKNLPVFITETGWSTDAISPDTQAIYYQEAFRDAWSDTGIVAITPFLLKANGSFSEFSFLDEDGKPTAQYQMIKSLPKIHGLPVLNQKPPKLLRQQKNILGFYAGEQNIAVAQASTYRNFSTNNKELKKFSLTNIAMATFRWLITN
ncbi:hypothetical protein KJ980_00525 [Patescibacteria group bacterium]|nr:hypothetical protein [Patescibacteria group bacterium]MBU4098113.1 hypothetical protein [Patescibacteria group bacterium]